MWRGISARETITIYAIIAESLKVRSKIAHLLYEMIGINLCIQLS